MSIVIKKDTDIEEIKNETHQRLVRHLQANVISGMLEGIAEERREDYQKGVGYIVYIDNAHDLLNGGEALFMDESGINHEIFEKGTNTWEGVDYYLSIHMYVVTWLRDNDFGILYVFPEEILRDLPAGNNIAEMLVSEQIVQPFEPGTKKW